MRMELNLQKANEIQEKSALVQDKLMEFLQARLGQTSVAKLQHIVNSNMNAIYYRAVINKRN